MRWPFHFGRAAPDGGKARAQESAARRRDWESLPPIQRAVADPELTAPTMDFVESLAGSHDPATSLEPLGHHVSIEAPHGLVSGIATAARSYSPSIEMIGRPRRGRQGVTVQRSVDETQPALEVGGTAESEDVLEPISPVRDLPPVEATAPSPKPLTRLADSDRTAVLSPASVQRTGGQTAAPAVDRSAIQERSAAVERSPEGVIGAPPAAEQAPVAQRLTLGQSRRLGLGPPLATGTVPVLQRSAASTPPPPSVALPLARPAASVETTPQPSLEPKSDAPQPAPESVPVGSVETAVQSMSSVPATPSPVSRLPVLPLIAIQTKGSSPTPSSPVQGVANDQPAVTQRLAATPPARPEAAQSPITVPLVSSRPPLLTGRSTVPGAPDAAPDGEGGEDIASAATVQLMPVSPIALEPVAAPSDRNQPALLNNPEFARTLIDQPARTPISPHAPEPPPQLSMRPAVQRAVAAPQQESPALSAFQPAFFAVSPFAGGMHPVQVQRQPEAAEAPVQAPVAAEAPAAAPVAPAGGAAPAHASDKELDELARKLHDRISDRIRYDLLLDRERAGMLTDLR